MSDHETIPVEAGSAIAIRRFRLAVVDGPTAGKTFESAGARCSIGTHPSNDLVLDDRTVSRFHCELVIDEDRARIRDLGSTNGTLLDGVAVVEALPADGAILRVGGTQIRFELAGEVSRLALFPRSELGTMVGRSPAMRAAFALLERAAASDVTVLLTGETGTGKGQAAETIHRESRRAGGPFVVVDCGAIPDALLESELFGHEKGAFTGADSRRIGAFEEADGGTIFLDELGELPPALQPKLLRVLENRQIRRVGGSGTLPVDVRIVAATNRDLRTEVNAGRFRSDLYFRLAVVQIALPSLRQRRDDLPPLVAALLARLGATAEQTAAIQAPETIAALQRQSWPGNVRELRNWLERRLVYDDMLPLADALDAGTFPAGEVDPDRPLAEARKQIVDRFEHAYLEALLARHDGKMAQAAAAAAGVNRVHLYRMLVRHGLK